MHNRRRFLHQDLLVDAVTPIGAFVALSNTRPGPALLFESAPGAGVGARRSMIALDARGAVRAFDGEVTVAIDGEDALIKKESPADAARRLAATLRPGPDDVAKSPF